MKHTSLILAIVLLAVLCASRAQHGDFVSPPTVPSALASLDAPHTPLPRCGAATDRCQGWSEAPRAQPLEDQLLYTTAPAGAGEPNSPPDFQSHSVIRPASHAPAPATFSFVDVFIDSGTTPLAAYQVELVGHIAGDDGQNPAAVTIVGVEGGAAAPFRDAPYYDPSAMQGERVIIGALSTLPADQLPRGKVRVARVHMMTTGTTVGPLCTLTLTTAAGPDAGRINAEASWQVGHADERK